MPVDALDELMQAHGATPIAPAGEPSLDSVYKRYPRLRSLGDVQVIDSRKKGMTDDRQLEYYPADESDNPKPGKPTIEIFNPQIQGQAYDDAIAADMLHGLKTADPKWAALRDQFVSTLTPKQVALDKRVYEDDRSRHGETRSFDDWRQANRVDAYVRGYLFPDAADEWRKGGIYTPEQQQLLDTMRSHLTSDDEGDSDPLDALMQEHGAMTAPDFRAANEKDASGNAVVAHTPDWSERLGLQEPTASPTLGFLRGAGTAVADMAEGATAGAASTIYHGGDLIRRGVGMDRIIDQPDVQHQMHAPDTVAGTIGKMGEQGAEFALPLSKVSKAAEGASLMTRAAIDAAASAGVAGVQSGGDTGAMTTAAALGGILPVAAAGIGATARATQRAAAGAREGGVGGAIARVIRSTAPVESKTMMVQALKPRSANVGFARDLDRALPEIKATEAELGKPIQTVDDLLTATQAAKKRVRAQYDAIAGPKRAIGSTVDGSSVADAIEKSIPLKAKLQDPRAVAAVLDKADTYRQSFPLEDMETLLKETNAELDAYYDKFPAARRKSIVSNPDVAHLVAEAKALRKAIYDTLDGPGQEPAARELQRRYGALMNVEEEALRRSNVAARQQPESLSEQIGQVRAAGEIARGLWKLKSLDISGAADIAAGAAMRNTAKFLKEQQTSDALVRRALAGVKDLPVPVPMPVPRPVAGLLGRGAIPMGPGPDGSFVRGVPAMRAINERPALPPAGGTAIITPPPEPVSGGPGVRPKSVVQRDPRTGRMRRIYTSEAR